MVQEGTKLTLVDLSLRAPPAEGISSSSHLNTQPSTSSEGEAKDSLSSLESVETASASSWKRGEVPSTTSGHSTTNMHSSYVLLHSSGFNPSRSSHANFIYSSMAQTNPNQYPAANSTSSSTPPSLGPITSPSSVSPNHNHQLNHQYHQQQQQQPNPQQQPQHQQQQQHQHHHQQQGTNLRNNSKHLTGVTIVGPITEL